MNLAVLRGMWAAASILVALTQTGCGGGGAGASQQQSAPPPVATAAGTSSGEASSAAVGAAGGSVTSSDGKFTLTIPAGALQETRAISIQPITNQAHGGSGPAFRLSPEGQTFSKPVTLSFNYSDADVNGSAPSALGVAFQRPDGTWEWVANPQVDTVARRVTIETTHFSDWSMVQGFRLLPFMSTVGTGKTVDLRVVYCYPDTGSPFIFGYGCKQDDGLYAWTGIAHGKVGEWSVDGVLGGNSTKGTVTPDILFGFNATFKAPSAVPTPDTVAVSIRVSDRDSTEKILIVANVKITESADYSGTVDFQLPFSTGKANVNWTKLGEVEGVPMYKASGTMEIKTTVQGCDAKLLTFPIVTNEDMSLGAYKMAVGLGSRYYFHLAANQPETVTLMCGVHPDQYPLEVPVYSLTSLAVGTIGWGCTEPPAYSDVKRLAGSWSCPDTQTSAAWEFNAP